MAPDFVLCTLTHLSLPSTEVQANGAYFLSTITYSEGTLTQTVINNGYPDIARLNLETIRIFGVNGTIDAILVNGEPHIAFENLPGNEVSVHNLNIAVNSRYTITFITQSEPGGNNSGARSLFGFNLILFSVALLYSSLTVFGVEALRNVN